MTISLSRGQSFSQMGSDETGAPGKEQAATSYASGWCRSIVSHGQPDSPS